MTLLAALAALEQEWRGRASKLPGPRHPTSWYGVYAQAADELAALRVRFEGEDPPRHHHPDCDMAVADCTCHMYEAPGPDPEPVKETPRKPEPVDLMAALKKSFDALYGPVKETR